MPTNIFYHLITQNDPAIPRIIDNLPITLKNGLDPLNLGANFCLIDLISLTTCKNPFSSFVLTNRH